MQKKGSFFLYGSIAFVILLIIIIFLYFSLITPNHENYYINQEATGELKNPTLSLSLEEAKVAFNESFVYYMLYQIKAYNLHNPPLSKDTPKIEIVVEDEVYNSDILDGVIYVSKGEIDGEDITIITDREEAVKMLKSKDYVGVSFEEGRSRMELKASKTILFSKGYLSLYQDLTGKSVTGSVIRIYAE